MNPRRKVFDVQNAAHTRLQIRWEYLMLRRCDGILFWFSCESICPIVLFELGTHLMVPGKPLFIGMHPEYQRRIDVVLYVAVKEQTSIIRPDILSGHYQGRLLGGKAVSSGCWRFSAETKSVS